MKSKHIELGGITLAVEKKRVKHLHLRVYPPEGRVEVSAPWWMSLEVVRQFTATKLDWIRRQQERLRARERVSPPEYRAGEGFFLWGERLTLKVVEAEGPPRVAAEPGFLVLRVRPGTSREARAKAVAAWQRRLLLEASSALVATWEPRLAVRVRGLSVRRMKTKWGSCTPRAGTIRLNTDLVSRPRDLLEYIVVHELLHLLEPSHGPRFRRLLDRHLPAWRELRDRLNRLSPGRGGEERRSEPPAPPGPPAGVW